MNQKVISAVAGAVLVVGIGGLVFSTSNARNAVRTSMQEVIEEASDDSDADDEVSDINATAPSVPIVSPKPGIAVGELNPSAPAPKSSSITAAEVVQHNSRESCWSTINGNVYDLTSWIPKHPGGERAILQLCGTDGSEKFNDQHGGDSRKVTILAGFVIGAAAQ